MSGLLDLPAELIEQIYDIHHDLVYEDDSSNVGAYGQIRLVCRYIERATRYSFRQFHFGCWILNDRGMHMLRNSARSQRFLIWRRLSSAL